ncbi:MAG: hypothetical protein A2X45_18040 [Lentisphaerae bacterium GWF2_50_93]|nr:MAG: hypothetical protein A2X45_18040 [Lentisphaerae bacterium GWF2_50_93]
MKKFQSFKWASNQDVNEVCLAGDFNGWTPVPMEKTNDAFQALVELEPGEYQYKFIIDGQWIHDPAAPKATLNAFGTTNSVVFVD